MAAVVNVLASTPAFADLRSSQTGKCLRRALNPGSQNTQCWGCGFDRERSVGLNLVLRQTVGRSKPGVVCAVGDVSAEGTNYLIAGAVAIALIGTALPILFSRKDLCPECDGAGFVRKPGVALRANAARKDLPQIVCPRCNGLGKIGQIDKV